MVSRLSRTAPLLSALLSCAATLRLRSTSVASSLSRHVKPPQSKRGQTHPLIAPQTTTSRPTRAVSQNADRTEGQIRGVHPSAAAASLAGKVERKFRRLLLLRCALFFQRSGGRHGAGKANENTADSCVLHAWNIGINMLKQLH